MKIAAECAPAQMPEIMKSKSASLVCAVCALSTKIHPARRIHSICAVCALAHIILETQFRSSSLAYMLTIFQIQPMPLLKDYLMHTALPLAAFRCEPYKCVFLCEPTEIAIYCRRVMV